MTKKRFILMVTVILVLFVTYSLVKKSFVIRGEKTGEIIYESENIVLQVQEERKDAQNLVILGEGYSKSVDNDGRVIECDPFMLKLDEKLFGQETQVIYVYFPFDTKEQPERLATAGMELANYINEELILYKDDDIIAIGHSKCGVCFANMAQWLTRKITIVTISSPFKGTILTDKDLCRSKTNNIEFWVYNRIFSNHQVDKDIIPDSYFLQNVNYDGLETQNHINIISKFNQNPNDLVDCVLWYIKENYLPESDGIVPVESQILEYSNTIRVDIEASHATSMKKGIEIVKEICDLD